MRTDHVDDLGDAVSLPRPLRRVVSLVPSLTEAIATVDRSLLVGATDWCTHPGDLDVQRVRGTKNPDLKAIRTLVPDLVVANKEENRQLDVQRLRESGVPVWVTDIRTVPQALSSMSRLITEALDRPLPQWLVDAHQHWTGPLPEPQLRVATAIWRDPWMVVGQDTFTHDLLARCGMTNVFSAHPERYPHVELETIDNAGADVVLLPDEPYLFTDEDGPEAFTHTPTRLVSGRLITWYGPSLLEAARILPPLTVGTD